MKKLISTLLAFVIVLLLLIPFSEVSASSIPETIDYWVTPKVVHIKDDDLLKSYLALDYNNNTSQMVCASKDRYTLNYDSNISISDKSMSVEIIGHVFPDTVANYLPGWLALIIQNHTSVIDSGEKSIDRDRWVWDSIAFVLGDYNQITSEARNDEVKINQEIVDGIYNQNRMTVSCKLDKDIMLKVVTDIQNNDVDPILLEVFEG
ncbi:hypothetical protein [Facklamia miroungae]|uniref:Uncharacterized protein n=1 Tax=Facklamia miroungae TaxID=120956 RepID=A0A1G7SQ27_9LACT|nr:hypothetical protein [Facklamia miroungae]NKZ29577.1 hypothetical protein [Facklamia miroungae]SDG25041.1 hypothetical protein SAMN05421791_104107 [Facklamia miroungae]